MLCQESIFISKFWYSRSRLALCTPKRGFRSRELAESLSETSPPPAFSPADQFEVISRSVNISSSSVSPISSSQLPSECSLLFFRNSKVYASALFLAESKSSVDFVALTVFNCSVTRSKLDDSMRPCPCTKQHIEW